MTFDEYIKNPMGNRSQVISHREMYRKLYTEKFEKTMLREANKIEYKVFNKGDLFYVYMKIPSEVIEKFYYDVVIEFRPSTPISLVDRVISGYDIRFFSNDPAFVFTFAHVFIKEKMFIDDLKLRMSKEAIKTKPKVTNPNEQISYVKSLYFAYLAMKNKLLFNKDYLKSISIPYNKELLLAMITPADEKIEARQDAQKALNASNKKEKTINKDNQKKEVKDTIKNNPKKIINGIKTTKIIGSTVKKTNSTKKSKKI